VTTTVLTALPAKWVMADACTPIAKATIITAASGPTGSKPTAAKTAASTSRLAVGARDSLSSRREIMAPTKKATSGAR
jgi:hypothetical protein